MKNLNSFPAHEGAYFSVFYLLAVLVCISVAIYEGYRRKYPMHQWLLIIASGTFFLIVGTKLFSYSVNDLLDYLKHCELVENKGITIIGGLVGLLFGISFAKVLLQFKYSVTATIAVALPVSMAIQKFGCLFSGCCFGNPSNLPWAIAYPPHSPAYVSHLESGLIDSSCFTSLSVHPIQMYAVICYLVIALVVWQSMKRLKRPASGFLLTLALFSVYRFFEEFLRDSKANFFPETIFLGLNQIQWGMLVSCLIFAIAIVIREKMPIKSSTHTNPEVSSAGIVLFALLLLILVSMGKFWFNSLERIIIWTALIPALSMVTWHFYKKISVSGKRMIPLSLMILSLFFISQSEPNDTTSKDKGQLISYNTLSIGGMAGQFYNKFQTGMMESGSCGDAYFNPNYEGYYQHTNYMGAVSISKTTTNGKYFYRSAAFRGYLGVDNYKNVEKKLSGQLTNFAINPYFTFDWKFIGFGFGVHLGSFRFAYFSEMDQLTVNNMKPTGSLYDLWIFPQFGLRVGPKDIFSVEAHLADLFPSSSMMPLSHFGFGSGLGKMNKNSIGLGKTLEGYYFSGTKTLGKNWKIELLYLDNFQKAFASKRCLSFAFHYNYSGTPKK